MSNILSRKDVIERRAAFVDNLLDLEGNRGRFRVVSKSHFVSRGKLYYWHTKCFDQTFHPLYHGGWRNGTFNPDEVASVIDWVIKFFEDNPLVSLSDVTEHVSREFGRKVSYQCMSRFLQSMNWSWKIPTRFQIHKYNIANIERYFTYVEWIQNQEWSKLKFLDESHFVPKDLGHRKVCGMKNQRVYTREETLRDAHSSVTIITSLDPNIPVYFDYREQSNTQHNFLDFILVAIAENILVDGDFLILDNASLHHGADIVLSLMDITHLYGVEFVYLPAYSPELNPCELVFAQIKKYLRKVVSIRTVLDKVCEAVAYVTVEHMFSYYRHCVLPKQILPELYDK
jgi:hypothetical protein